MAAALLPARREGQCVRQMARVAVRCCEKAMGGFREVEAPRCMVKLARGREEEWGEVQGLVDRQVRARTGLGLKQEGLLPVALDGEEVRHPLVAVCRGWGEVGSGERREGRCIFESRRCRLACLRQQRNHFRPPCR